MSICDYFAEVTSVWKGSDSNCRSNSSNEVVFVGFKCWLEEAILSGSEGRRVAEEGLEERVWANQFEGDRREQRGFELSEGSRRRRRTAMARGLLDCRGLRI